MKSVNKLQDAGKEGPWGYEDIMVLAAFRYCVGRRSYIVYECVSWMLINWPKFGDFVKTHILVELENLFDMDDKFRTTGNGCLTLGDDCDRIEWERIRDLGRGSADSLNPLNPEVGKQPVNNVDLKD